MSGCETKENEASDPYFEGFKIGYLWHFWSKRLLGFLASMIDIPSVVEGRSIMLRRQDGC